MKTFAIAAIALLGAANAVSIKQELDRNLAQVDAQVNGEEECKCYKCPPALGECPAVAQPAGPCTDILEQDQPLCYCNSGFMHTDWDHAISYNVGADAACEFCGAENPSQKGDNGGSVTIDGTGSV